MRCRSRARTSTVLALTFAAGGRGHKGRGYSILLGLALCLATSTRAAEAPPPLRLADVLEEAQQANPQLRVVRQRVAALRQIPAQVSSYDDPTLSWEGWDIPESLRIDAAENNIFRVAQKIPWPGKRTLAGTVAEREADAAQAEVRSAELDLATEVERAYYGLWLAHQKRDILVRDRVLVERITRTTEAKYGVGEATQADALRAQLELTHMAIEADTARLAIDSAAAELNALLSRPPDQPLGVPEDPPMQPTDASLETLISWALERRPELTGQRAAIGQQESAVELAELNRRPDFEFSVGRFLNYGRSDGFGAMASVTVPFIYNAKYNAGIAEARARLAGAESELRGWQDRIRREVAQAYTRMRTAALQHGLARGTHIPQAEQTLRVTEGAFQAGRADFVSVLDTLRTVETIHVQHVEAEAALAIAMADLARAVGGPLAPAER